MEGGTLAWIWIVIALALVLSVVPAALACRANQDVGNNLMKQGVQADAEILGYRMTCDGPMVSYRFTPRGAPAAITCERFLGVKVDQPAPGSRVKVRYMAKYPSISLLEPFARHQAPV